MLKIFLWIIGLTVLAGGVLVVYFIYSIVIGAGRGFTAINEPLSNSYWEKGGHVYYCLGGNFFGIGATLLENAELQSFVVLNSMFAKDAQSVYFRDTIIDGADSASFELVGDTFSKDRAHVYYLSKPVKKRRPRNLPAPLGRLR